MNQTQRIQAIDPSAALSLAPSGPALSPSGLAPVGTPKRSDSHLQLVNPDATVVVAPRGDGPAAPRGMTKKMAILTVLGVCVALAGLAYGGYGYWFEDTDDAQVDANISTVSPRVNGTVAHVHVTDNQRVKAGDLLFELDDRDTRVAADIARAALAQAEAELAAEVPVVQMTETSNRTLVETSAADVARARAAVAFSDRSRAQASAQLAQAQASMGLASSELDRARALYEDGAISKSELDQKQASLDVQKANVAALRENVHAMARKTDEERAGLTAMSSRMKETKDNSPRTLEMRQAFLAVRRAKVQAAAAHLSQAELELSYMQVHAPVDGIVGKKSVSEGDRVQPGQGLLALTHLDGVWVTANFRETQLARIHPGQRVNVHVDTLSRSLTGTVESLPGATGSKFSLFPPENASANYVKVVQRMPVRIRFDDGQPDVASLRPGMSVEPRVRVR